jgi:hypothetical protein
MRKTDIKNGTKDAEELVKTYNTHKEQGKEYILPRSLGNGLLIVMKILTRILYLMFGT